jgi:hypothetical protein
MGRRFPEFCILLAACRVSLKASSSATGHDRVASYQAAINSVAKQYYEDRPFMVEVLNKWLEMNQDFVRDPVGYAASNSLPTPPSTPRKGHSTISTIQDVPDQTITSAAPTSGHPLAQITSTVADSVPLSLPSDAEAPEPITDSCPAASTSRMGSNDLDDPTSSSNSGHDVPVPTHKFLPLSWAQLFRSPPPLWNLRVCMLPSGVASSLSSSRLAASKSPTQQISSPSETRWFSQSFLASSCKGWWDFVKKSFALRDRLYPKPKQNQG